MNTLIALDEDFPQFPDPATALTDPDGLLALGGNLYPDVLVDAYRRGIFPWYDDSQPILWWSPSQRAVILPEGLHISRSLAKVIRRQLFSVTTDTAFEQVVAQCSAPRSDTTDDDAAGTWITDEMANAYCQLHLAGQAHSIEVWFQGQLVGGLYGIATGAVFSGESMFSREANASKIALTALANTLFSSGYQLVDCQIQNPHLASMGAIEINRSDYLNRLQDARQDRLVWPTKFSPIMASTNKSV